MKYAKNKTIVYVLHSFFELLFVQTSNSTYNFQQNSDASNHYLEAVAHLDRLWLRAHNSYSEKENIHYLVLDHTKGRDLSITHICRWLIPPRAWTQVTLLAPVHPIPPFFLNCQDLRRGRHIPAKKTHVKISNYWPDFQWQIHTILMKNSRGITKGVVAWCLFWSQDWLCIQWHFRINV